jgi:hypothetical protein
MERRLYVKCALRILYCTVPICLTAWPKPRLEVGP